MNVKESSSTRRIHASCYDSEEEESKEIIKRNKHFNSENMDLYICVYIKYALLTKTDPCPYLLGGGHSKQDIVLSTYSSRSI